MSTSKTTQGSDSWLEWRRGGIGSSDAPCVMGCDPYRSRNDVLLEKLGQGKPVIVNIAMELGTKWEPAARALHYFETGLEMEPAELVHPEFSYLRASLDGYLEGDHFLEIKYMGEKNFDLIAKTQTPLEHHWVQIQHQCLVTGMDRCTYIPYTLSEDKKSIARIQYVTVKAEPSYCYETLAFTLTEFWHEVCDRRKIESAKS